MLIISFSHSFTWVKRTNEQTTSQPASRLSRENCEASHSHSLLRVLCVVIAKCCRLCLQLTTTTQTTQNCPLLVHRETTTIQLENEQQSKTAGGLTGWCKREILVPNTCKQHKTFFLRLASLTSSPSNSVHNVIVHLVYHLHLRSGTVV